MRIVPRAFLTLILLFLFAAPATTQGAASIPGPAERAPAAQGPASGDFGYGFAMIEANGARAELLGFNWIQTYAPPKTPQPTRVLQRVRARVSDLSNPTQFRTDLANLVYSYGAHIDAYEIGNEVNLSTEWGAPPSAIDYIRLLREARSVLDVLDPGATIVSAGLSTVGRVSGSWSGHAGHNGSVQDEREYLKEFLSFGGYELVDVIGYHPMGFRAGYATPPDAYGDEPEDDCSHGLCFRSAEKFYAILRDRGYLNARIWATEFGWIVSPPQPCVGDPSWDGRVWQAVSPETQAANLTGAFRYARVHWPWMEAMFVFNLDLNTVYYYPLCEQMRYYSVLGRPAEIALATMPKTLYRVYLPLIRR